MIKIFHIHIRLLRHSFPVLEEEEEAGVWMAGWVDGEVVAPLSWISMAMLNRGVFETGDLGV